jgi:antitoxin component YwqK of YwqJK toxin-antitoxin module
MKGLRPFAFCFLFFALSCRIKHVQVYSGTNKVLAKGFVLISGKDSTDIGRWNYYDEKGNKRESVKYKGGRYNANFHGKRVIYYSNGNKQFVEYYDHGRPIKRKTFFYDNGYCKMIYIYKGRTGTYKFYKAFDNSGKIIEEGSLGENAKIIKRDSNGYIVDTLSSIYQARIGKWTEFYKNGRKKSEGEYLKYIEIKCDTIISYSGDSLSGLLIEKTPVTTPIFIKTGVWKVYNEKGVFIRNDSYYFGIN